MGVPKLKVKLSVADYLEGENDGQFRHEFVGGEVYAMAGATDRHHRITFNIAQRLDRHLENSECEAFMVDMKLRAAEEVFYYPDVFVACDQNPESAYYRTQPVLVIEVLSHSTREIDRREKLQAYQKLKSVQEYVIIDQDKMYVELHRRQPNGSWLTHFYNRSDTDEVIEFQSVNLELTLEDIYRRVKFEDGPH